jgi:hypothetical protein
MRIPDPSKHPELAERISTLAARLAAADERFEAWATPLGVRCAEVAGNERFGCLCELDALVAHLYGLSVPDVEHIFATFHDAWRPGRTHDHPTLGNYNDRLKATLGHFGRWGKRA